MLSLECADRASRRRGAESEHGALAEFSGNGRRRMSLLCCWRPDLITSCCSGRHRKTVNRKGASWSFRAGRPDARDHLVFRLVMFFVCSDVGDHSQTPQNHPFANGASAVCSGRQARVQRHVFPRAQCQHRRWRTGRPGIKETAQGCHPGRDDQSGHRQGRQLPFCIHCHGELQRQLNQGLQRRFVQHALGDAASPSEP